MLLKSTQQFLRRLHAIKAVQVDAQKGFRLALHDKNPNAPLSPFYFTFRTPDHKDGPLQPEDVTTIASALMHAAASKRLKYTAVSGIPRAGTPFAKSITTQTKIPYVLLKKNSAKSRSMSVQTSISPVTADGLRHRVLLVDDLITRADTKWTAIDAMRRAGFEVAGIAVYLDREQGGSDNLLKSGIPIVSAVKLTQVLKFYEQEGLIGVSDMQKIRAYLAR